MRLNPMVLMWIQIATGFMGALTLVFVGRFVARFLGFLSDAKVYFSPKGGGRDAVLAMARNLQLTPNLRPENCRAPAKKALSRSRKSVRNSIELAEGLRSCASVDVEGNKKPLAHERPRIAPRPFR